jgi:hypothetical protein
LATALFLAIVLIGSLVEGDFTSLNTNNPLLYLWTSHSWIPRSLKPIACCWYFVNSGEMNIILDWDQSTSSRFRPRDEFELSLYSSIKYDNLAGWLAPNFLNRLFHKPARKCYWQYFIKSLYRLSITIFAFQEFKTLYSLVDYIFSFLSLVRRIFNSSVFMLKFITQALRC